MRELAPIAPQEIAPIATLDGVIKCQHAWCCEVAEELYSLPVLFSVNGYVAKASVALCRKCGNALRGMQG